uniref:Uncharacterized protein n=1 Tax=Arundo donax TaxID=35708 RepID=A0A0A9BAF1_ARUDO
MRKQSTNCQVLLETINYLVVPYLVSNGGHACQGPCNHLSKYNLYGRKLRAH